MVSLQQASKQAMALADVEEKPHFEKTSFRVSGKIFMTLDAAHDRACFKLSVTDQDLFSLPDKDMIYPVPNKWGLQGWTFVNLKLARLPVFREILKAAYAHVRNSGFSKKLKS